VKTSLANTIPLALAIGGLSAALVIVLPFSPESSSAWLIGALAASVTGAIALVVKTLLGGSTAGLTPAAAMKALLGAQVSSFLLRLLVVGVGAFAVRALNFSPIMFAISFALVSLVQQVLETRSLLAARTAPVAPVAAKNSEVTP